MAIDRLSEQHQAAWTANRAEESRAASSSNRKAAPASASLDGGRCYRCGSPPRGGEHRCACGASHWVFLPQPGEATQ